MVDIEKYIGDKLSRALNVLRGYLELGVANRILRELIFLMLLNLEIKNKNSYFLKRINGHIDFEQQVDNYENMFSELYEFTKSNEVLSELIVELYRVNDRREYRGIEDVIAIINDIKGISSVELFKCFIDLSFKNDKMEIQTPQCINKLISDLLSEAKMKSIYDPVIGTGVLCLDVASQHKNVEVYGQDINRDMLNICKMLLILDERIENIENISEGNTIINPANLDREGLKKYDCVICNYPFGMKEWGYNEISNYDTGNRFHRGLPSRSCGDYAFITHAIESLKDEGVAVVIANTGVLFKAGAEGEIRQKLVNENIIDCIITLPNNLMHGTGIPVNLMIFNKSKKHSDILFIDVSRKAQVNKMNTTISSEVINQIVDIYQQREEVEGLSRKVNISEIEKNSFNLNIQKYIDETIQKEVLNIKYITKDIEQLTEKLHRIQNEINELFN